MTGLLQRVFRSAPSPVRVFLAVLEGGSVSGGGGGAGRSGVRQQRQPLLQQRLVLVARGGGGGAARRLVRRPRGQRDALRQHLRDKTQR